MTRFGRAPEPGGPEERAIRMVFRSPIQPSDRVRRRLACAISVACGLSALACGIGCTSNASPRNAFFDARSAAVKARPGSGTTITTAAPPPAPSAFTIGDVARRPDRSNAAPR